MIFFKGCSRCSGDEALINDPFGWYRVCLMCGGVSYPEDEAEVEALKERAREADSPARVAPMAAAMS